MSGDLLEVLAEKLVLSGQLLISMLEELKRNAALNNFAALNSNIAQCDTANQAKAGQLHAELTILQKQLLAYQVCLINVARTHSQQSHCLAVSGSLRLLHATRSSAGPS